ncbi:MAG: Bax inhibitor-1/YccA family protein [Candidatus Peribacteraceae bacterium]|jgi:modulator of FtsH protease|nr:Bax inhibitor-1/YccA family protein [Candidatus Peribacteraceae bacterium]
MTFTSIRSRPVVLDSSSEAKVYGLFALALALTVVGVVLGLMYARILIGSGVQIFFLIGELILIFTSRMWMRSSPLNIILFAAFPLLSGITVTPYILYVLAGYVNGATILLNASAATVFMAAGSAVFALTTKADLSGMGRVLFMGLIGLIVIALLQLFVPSLRTGGAEVLISGVGVVLFAAFTAYDVQRVQMMGRLGANPFLLALSLYLDIFNLFLYILRFMLALSGNRR